MLVVVLQIPVPMASVNVVPVMRVVYQVRHAYLEPVCVEPLHHVQELLPDPTVMLQTTFANVLQLLMLSNNSQLRQSWNMNRNDNLGTEFRIYIDRGPDSSMFIYRGK